MKGTDSASLGGVIKALREAAGMTRYDLARATSDLTFSERGMSLDRRRFSAVSASMIAKIEQGSKGPSVKSLRTIAEALGVSTADLAERASAWETLASAGVAASALRTGAMMGTLGAAATSLVPGSVTAGVAVAAGADGIAQRKSKAALADALRDLASRLDQMSPADRAKVEAMVESLNGT